MVVSVGGSGKVPCTVCGVLIESKGVVTCSECGSEFDFGNPPAGGPLVKRGSTPRGKKVAEVLAARFLASDRIDLMKDPMAMQRVTEASERAGRELAEKGKTVVDIPFIAAGPSGPVNLKIKLKKEDLG